MDIMDKYLGEAVSARRPGPAEIFARQQDPIQVLDNLDFTIRKLEGILKAAGVKSLLKNIKKMNNASIIIRERLGGKGAWG
jgi:hypothetical protein